MWMIVAYACALGHVPMDIGDSRCAYADKWAAQFQTEALCEHFRGEWEGMETAFVKKEVLKPDFAGVVEVRCERSSV